MRRTEHEGGGGKNKGMNICGLYTLQHRIRDNGRCSTKITILISSYSIILSYYYYLSVPLCAPKQGIRQKYTQRFCHQICALEQN